MKIMIDTRPKTRRAVRGSFLSVPENPDAKQVKALAELRKLLKYPLKEKEDA